MQFLLVIIGLYGLFWGALGAAMGRRACMNPWVAALVSVVLPLIGLVVLLIIGATGDRPSRAAPLKTSFSAADLVLLGIGLSGGVLLALSGWFPWVSGSVGGEVAGTAEDQITVATADALGLSLYTTVFGALVIGMTGLTWRWGHRYLMPVIVTIAGVAALLGTLAIWSHATLAPLADRVREWGQAVTEVNGAEVDVSGEVTIGPGPWLALVGGALVIVWALLWSVVTTGSGGYASAAVPPPTRSNPEVPATTQNAWEDGTWPSTPPVGLPESWTHPQDDSRFIAGEEPKW